MVWMTTKRMRRLGAALAKARGVACPCRSSAPRCAGCRRRTGSPRTRSSSPCSIAFQTPPLAFTCAPKYMCRLRRLSARQGSTAAAARLHQVARDAPPALRLEDHLAVVVGALLVGQHELVDASRAVSLSVSMRTSSPAPRTQVAVRLDAGRSPTGDRPRSARRSRRSDPRSRCRSRCRGSGRRRA